MERCARAPTSTRHYMLYPTLQHRAATHMTELLTELVLQERWRARWCGRVCVASVDTIIRSQKKSFDHCWYATRLSEGWWRALARDLNVTERLLLIHRSNIHVKYTFIFSMPSCVVYSQIISILFHEDYVTLISEEAGDFLTFRRHNQ